MKLELVLESQYRVKTSNNAQDPLLDYQHQP